MTTTDNSRADALTPCIHADDPKACHRVRCQLGRKCIDDDMSPRQPAAAPIDAPALSENELSAILSASLNSYMTTAERACLRNLMRRVKAANPIVQPALAPQPSPADERAAFKVAHPHLDLSEKPDAWNRPAFVHSHVDAMFAGWQARAASANETADERAAKIHDYLNAPGMWAQIYCCAVFVRGCPSDMARSAADEAVKEFGDAACKTVADLTHTLDEVLRVD
ncbi:hypothetical protein [Burkholderia vietnamiensis]|uniref:hypothetical protein n=1 Tax=Burkholderia vietnamiensis TaxID=60552 RepID=UPI00264BD67C|nr:hypothetical protein [Burkholderia vietnamiensis]MDN8066295.1 hypothetical protein [Burkholderia vietnamiensis]